MSDKKTSEEIAASALADADYLRAVQDGTNVKVTFGNIKSWMGEFVPFLGTANSFLALNSFSGSILIAPLASTQFVTRFNATNCTPALQVLGTEFNGAAALNARFSNDGGGPRTFLAKSRGATVGTHVIVNSGDTIGTYEFGASDGTNIVDAAHIQASVAGVPGTDNMPTNLKFGTNRGSSVITYAFGAWSNGYVGIGADLAPDAPLTINSNTVAPVAPVAGTSYHAIGADTANLLSVLDAIAGTATFAGRRVQGTQSAKTVVVSGNIIVSMDSYGWDGSAFYNGASFKQSARETFSGTAGGSSASVHTTPLTTRVIAESTRFQPSGGVSIGATAIATDPGIGNLSVTNAIQMGSFTVATLPAGVNGRQVYCSNGRMYNGTGTLEGAGVGTGGMVSYNGAWKIVGTNQTVQA